MKRRKFLQTSARAMVATAFLSSPFTRVFAGNQDPSFDYIVFERTNKYALTDGGVENTYKQRIYFPTSSVYLNETIFLTELIELQTESSKVYQVYQTSYTASDYFVDDSVGSYATLEKKETNYNFTGLDIRFRYLNELEKLFFSENGNQLTAQYTGQQQGVKSLTAAKGYVKGNANLLNLGSDFVFIAPALGENEYDDLDCFLTSACVFHKGFPDDCRELQLLRNFRDQFMAGTEYGRELISGYYDIGPKAVKAILTHAQKDEILEFIYQDLVLPSVTLIENRQYELAMEYYKSFTEELAVRLQLS